MQSLCIERGRSTFTGRSPATASAPGLRRPVTRCQLRTALHSTFACPCPVTQPEPQPQPASPCSLCSNVPGIQSAGVGLRHQHACEGTRQRRTLITHAKGKQEWGYSKKGKRFQVDLNGNRFDLEEDNLWVLALPAALLFALATIIGPLVIGGLLAAVAIGGALSLGAVALSAAVWLPFIIISSIFFFTAVVPFGIFATLGLGLFLPKVLSLLLTGAGLGLGFMAASRFMPRTLSSGNEQREVPLSTEQDGPTVSAVSKSIDGSRDEGEEEIRRAAKELREFDEMMADREQDRKLEDWRRRTRG